MGEERSADLFKEIEKYDLLRWEKKKEATLEGKTKVNQ